MLPQKRFRVMLDLTEFYKEYQNKVGPIKEPYFRLKVREILEDYLTANESGNKKLVRANSNKRN